MFARELFELYDLLENTLTNFEIEESRSQEVTLDNYKNSMANNCMHYVMVHDKCRIVVQTYKALCRKGDIDIVQGKPDDSLLEIIEALNKYSDNQLNYILIFYNWYHQSNINSYFAESGSLIIGYNHNSILWDTKQECLFCTDNFIPFQELQEVISFVNKVNLIMEQK